jgi:hypothetical protein
LHEIRIEVGNKGNTRFQKNASLFGVINQSVDLLVEKPLTVFDAILCGTEHQMRCCGEERRLETCKHRFAPVSVWSFGA